MQSAPFLSVLKDGSCAIRGCESCQVGNQAALSGLSGVPQGRLFGADGTVNVCKSISTERCMVLSDVSNDNFGAYAEERECTAARFYFFRALLGCWRL